MLSHELLVGREWFVSVYIGSCNSLCFLDSHVSTPGVFNQSTIRDRVMRRVISQAVLALHRFVLPLEYRLCKLSI